MLHVTYIRESDPQTKIEAQLDLGTPNTAAKLDNLHNVLRVLSNIPQDENIVVVACVKQRKSTSRVDNPQRQDSENRKKSLARQLPAPVPISWLELYDYVGPRVAKLWMNDFEPDDVTESVDSLFLIERFFCEGGLIKFLSECFPYSTSLSPFCDDQIQSVSVIESCILNGGVQQCLEPRSFGKTARVSRASLWALLGGFRKFTLSFQSSEPKAKDNLERIKAELIVNKALYAMWPVLGTACEHVKNNNKASQEADGVPTNIIWQADEMRLPDLYNEHGDLYRWAGGRVMAMAFGKATGLSIVNKTSGADNRPDLLLIDDPQSQDNAGFPPDTKKLLSVYFGSLRYLGGRTKEIATFFMQTIFEGDDMADSLRKDPSIQTIQYSAMKTIPVNIDWWRNEYRARLFNFGTMDSEGQARARAEATEFYLENQAYADEGAVVAWPTAFDPKKCASAIQSLMNNFLTDERSFWTQDQNMPVSSGSTDDIRCPASKIVSKQIPEVKRGMLPDYTEKIVCHIDCQDDLLYYAIAAGSSNMAMHILDYQTFPRQSSHDFLLRSAPMRFTNVHPYSTLPKMQDRLLAALNDLIKWLTEKAYMDANGVARGIDRVFADMSDGDHKNVVHTAANMSMGLMIPMKGWSPRAGQLQMEEQKLPDHNTKRGDHWTRRLDKNTHTRWIEADVSYFKTKLHEGFRAPLGTSESITLWDTAGSIMVHKMAGEHCNAEVPAWTEVTKAGSSTAGFYSWSEMPGRDNHRFDNFVGCLVALNYEGCTFPGAPKPKQKRAPIVQQDTASAWASHSELYR